MRGRTGNILIGMLMFLLASVGHAATTFEQGWRAYQQQDYSRALALWLPLAQEGHAQTQNNVGMVYLRSRDKGRDYAKAAQWFRRAAAQGNPHAQTSLGSLYAQGLGVERDYFRAFEWFYEAARQGYPQAQYNLGQMYLEGLAVSADDVKAMQWYRRAASQGHGQARDAVKALLEHGRGIKRLPYAKDSRWSKFG